MNNLFKRIITGIFVVITILGSIILNQYLYFALFGIIVFLGIFELQRLLKAGQLNIQSEYAFVIGIFFYVTTFCVVSEIISPLWFLILIPLIFAVFITELFSKSGTPVVNVALTLFVPLYIAVPFSFLHLLAFYENQYCCQILLGFFIMIWSNDTGAYLIGVNFGKRRLLERISPKKSWEGAIGGFILTLISALILSYFYHNFSLINWLIIGAIISVTGILGDLTGSLIKRSVNIKDSGNILPGHGGIIDRFDSVIFAAPMVYCYLIFVSKLLTNN